VWIDTRLDGGEGVRVGEPETKVGKQDFKYLDPEEEIA
jgi:NAD+ synthase (glutamine-hydrolysing)